MTTSVVAEGGSDQGTGRRICSRCVCDTTIPGIRFDSSGVCNFCHTHDAMEKLFPKGDAGKARVESLVQRIRAEGRGKEYDCVVGVSGGRDSTYLLWTAMKLGLRPLAVHFDNGWNSEIAANNIKVATEKLNVDLHTVVADWEEFKDLQRSFLFASVPDAEVPTDYVIISVLFRVAAEIGVRYVLNGHSFRTEGIAPLGWTYMDGRYVRSVHRLFGTGRATSFPVMSMMDLLHYTLVKRIRSVDLLQNLEYDHKAAMEVLTTQVGWRYYGGHHHESVYTHFFQSYMCPRKFNIDKRKTEYSALIRSGQMERQRVLDEIGAKPYPYDPEVVDYAVSKLGFSKQEFADIMATPPKSFRDYPTYYPAIRALAVPIRVACGLRLLPQVFYHKFIVDAPK